MGNGERETRLSRRIENTPKLMNLETEKSLYMPRTSGLSSMSSILLKKKSVKFRLILNGKFSAKME